MILCIAQISPCWQNPEQTLDLIKLKVAEAKRYGASFIAFPEQIFTGWDPMDGDTFVQSEEGGIVSALRKYAYESSIGILGSYRESHHPRPRNTTVAIGPDGCILARYSKLHLFSPGGENVAYDPGEHISVFSYLGCQCGIAICYDLRFADLFRLYRDAGVHLMLVPSAWPAARMHHFQLFITARAAEFQMYVAGINTVGVTPVDHYSGGSVIAGPDGTIVCQGSDQQELLYTEINPEYAENVRSGFPVHRDRKDALYRSMKPCSHG
ncbi:MAG: carbon-nitrogen hydrolase family protein [Methanospirillum sp.]|uniref:carbon-nitrogen hydrolase family protein n=1 Tax=Methanospirillum sp. TaxID=45200 RepID=UPI002370D8E7|nr:carbon-nitrogen hydrolase family protein [Methanospirillum sp.]MDD1728956.1 carbon-nitrogen hydrolase family protein [Methanospirillum sp.]